MQIPKKSSDEALLTAILANNGNAEIAFAILHERYRKRIFGLLRCRIGSSMSFTADDVAQEVWQSLLKTPPAEAIGGTLWPWLMVTTLNTIRKLCESERAAKRMPVGGGIVELGTVENAWFRHIFPATETVGPDLIAERNETLNVIAEMQPPLRAVLECVIANPTGTIASMADTLQIPLRTFERRLTEARLALAEKLQLEIPTTFKKTPGKRSQPA